MVSRLRVSELFRRIRGSGISILVEYGDIGPVLSTSIHTPATPRPPSAQRFLIVGRKGRSILVRLARFVIAESRVPLEFFF